MKKIFVFNLNMCSLPLQIDLISRWRGSKAGEGSRTARNKSSNNSLRRGRAVLCESCLLENSLKAGTRAHKHVWLIIYRIVLSSRDIMRKSAAHRSRLGGRKHVSLQILAIINPSSVEKTTGSETCLIDDIYSRKHFRKYFLFLSLRFLSRKLLIPKINSFENIL